MLKIKNKSVVNLCFMIMIYFEIIFKLWVLGLTWKIRDF